MTKVAVFLINNVINQRNFVTNRTILSGNLGVAGDVNDNAHHVLFSFGDVGTAVLDGFTILNGNADVDEAYPFADGYSPSRAYGGGIYVDQSSPTLTNVTISRNIASTGGGLTASTTSTITLQNSIVAENTATTTAQDIWVDHDSDIQTSYSLLFGNSYAPSIVFAMIYSGRSLTSSNKIPMYCPNTPIVSN
jgi:hypothetical protein